MDDIICNTCGAAYHLDKIHIGVRDKDQIECHYCGNAIYSWNGSNIYSEEEIHGPTRKYTQKKK